MANDKHKVTYCFHLKRIHDEDFKDLQKTLFRMGVKWGLKEYPQTQHQRLQDVSLVDAFSSWLHVYDNEYMVLSATNYKSEIDDPINFIIDNRRPEPPKKVRDPEDREGHNGMAKLEVTQKVVINIKGVKAYLTVEQAINLQSDLASLNL